MAADDRLSPTVRATAGPAAGQWHATYDPVSDPQVQAVAAALPVPAVDDGRLNIASRSG